MLKRSMSFVLGLFALFLVLVSNAEIIDSFDITPMIAVGDPQNPAYATAAASEAIGGYRTINISSRETVWINTDNNPGTFFTFPPLPGFHAWAVSISWDANGAGLGGIDLTADGSNAFEVSTGFSVVSNYYIDIHDTYGNQSTGSVTIDYSEPIPFASLLFTDLQGSADVSSVNSIRLYMDSGSLDTADSAEIDYVRTVSLDTNGNGNGDGDVTFLNPGPSYLSFADSPFNGLLFDGSCEDSAFLASNYFCLEDFENYDDEWPGVSLVGDGAISVGALTDSVDADDGEIDGQGGGGYSYVPRDFVSFVFDEDILGNLPTHVGIVFTDVGNTYDPDDPTREITTCRGNLTFTAFDENGDPLGSIFQDGVGIPEPSAGLCTRGQTEEDRFFGVIYSGGISSITVGMNAPTWEMDHLQYGYAGVEVIPGDFDGNNNIDRDDLNILLDEIGNLSLHDPTFDLNGDGVVNIVDARYLVANLCTLPRCAAK